MDAADFDRTVRLGIYHHVAGTGHVPTLEWIAGRVAADAGAVREAYRRLSAQRVLVLEDDGESIRMAPPFSGIPTGHVVQAGSTSYFANCAWDALGIPAALHRPATVRSRCAQSAEPLVLDVGPAGPAESDWLFHCLVPATHWWDDIVFT